MSNDIDIEIEVNDKQIARRIEKAIDAGIADAAGDVGDGMENRAETKIEREAVWRGELLESLTETHQKTGDTWHIVLRNTAPHAGPQEYGAEFDTLPNIENLIPWVRDNLWAYTINDGNLQPDPNLIRDGGEPSTYTTKQLSHYSADIEKVVPAEDSDMVGGGAEYKTTWVIHYSDGTHAVFKEDEGASAAGANKGERLFTEWSREFEVSLGPENTRGLLDSEGEIGNFQRYIPDSEPAKKSVTFWYNDIDDEGYLTPEEFIRDYEEQLAYVSLFDYLMGNDDRHLGNFRMDFDGRLHAIDNGPMGSAASPEWSRLAINLDFFDTHKYPDQDLEGAVKSMLERQEEIFERLKNDTDLRERLLERYARQYSLDDTWYMRMDDILFPDDESNFKSPFDIVDASTGKTRYEKHIDKVIDALEHDPDDQDPEPAGAVSQAESDTDIDIGGTIEDLMGDL